MNGAVNAVSGGNHVLAGRWDDPDASLAPPFRCRWYFSWAELPSGLIAGYFAGYEGGGAFVEERFHARFRDERLVEFVWNGRDHVTGQDRSTEELPKEVAACNEEHFELFMRWHDPDRWEEGFLCLAPGREQGLVMLPDALFLPPESDVGMAMVAALARHTGILCSFDISLESEA